MFENLLKSLEDQREKQTKGTQQTMNIQQADFSQQTHTVNSRPSGISNNLLSKITENGVEIQQVLQDEELQPHGYFEGNSIQIESIKVSKPSQIPNQQSFHKMHHNFFSNNHYQQIRRLALQLHGMHGELKEYFEGEKLVMQYFWEKMGFQVEEFVGEMRRRIQASTEQKISLFANEIQEKNAKIQMLTDQLNVNNSRNNSKVNPVHPTICNQCKVQLEQLQQLKSQLNQNQNQVERLLIENESLQQYIFDVQQKVAGIDLQVQKRLKERQKSTKAPLTPRMVSIDEQHIEGWENLNQQIQKLNEKCRYYEGVCLKQSELKELERQLTKQTKRVRELETGLNESIVKLEYEKDRLLRRETETISAEQNLAKKIYSYRQKESQLQRREAELEQKQQSYMQMTKKQSTPYIKNDYQYKQSIELNKSDEQISLRSFGPTNHMQNLNNSSPEDFGMKNSSKVEYNMKKSFPYEERIEIEDVPKLEFKNVEPKYEYNPLQHEKYEKYHQDKEKYYQRQDSKKYVPMPHNKSIEKIRTNIAKPLSKYSFDSPSYKNDYQSSRVKIHMPATNNVHLTRASPAHNKQHSKGPRSTSKSVKQRLHTSNYRPNHKVAANRGEVGLGNKLERLREEIKREIDAIK